MFEMTGVSKAFGDLHALCEVDLRVHPEQTTVLIGPSGCGKSTLIRLKWWGWSGPMRAR